MCSKLAGVSGKLAGGRDRACVIDARFPQHVGFGIEVVRHLHASIHLLAVLARIERSPAYPGAAPECG